MTRLLLDEPPLLVMPSLAKAIGLEASIVLQQLHYWSAMARPRDDGRRWVFNTVTQWAEQFPFWSERTTRRILADLRESGVVDAAEFNASKGDRTMFYAIDYDRLSVVIGESASVQTGQTMRPICPEGPAKLATSLKEQETTTETIKDPPTTRARASVRAKGQALALPLSPVVIELPLSDGSAHAVTEADVQLWARIYPAVDVRAQLLRMLDWCGKNPRKLKTPRGIGEFIKAWLSDKQDNPKHAQHQPTGRPAAGASAIERVHAANAAAGHQPGMFLDDDRPF